MNLEEKVDLLVSWVQTLNRIINCVDTDNLSETLSKACDCLNSHDLIGLQIISVSIKNSRLKDVENIDIQNLQNKIIGLVKDIENDLDKNVIPLTESEELFLNLSYYKFFDICKEIYKQEFWEQSPQYRFYKISQAFSIYNEILTHEPFNGVLIWLSKYRPPMESEISGSLFKFIRNVLVHFPFYDTWDDVWINKDLVNWKKPNQSIDKFLEKFSGKPNVKYRFKETSKQGFTYVTINFPKNYNSNKIYLKNIIKEEEGVKFALVMMIRVLNTQIELIKE